MSTRDQMNGDQHSPLWTVEPGIPSTERIVAFANAIARPGVASDPAVQNWCYAVAQSGRVYYKRDILTGVPWDLKGRWDGSTGDPSRRAADILAIAVNQLHPERVYLLTSDKVARSTNSGADWTVVNGSF